MIIGMVRRRMIGRRPVDDDRRSGHCSRRSRGRAIAPDVLTGPLVLHALSRSFHNPLRGCLVTSHLSTVDG